MLQIVLRELIKSIVKNFFNNLYPSITKKLLNNAISFAKQHIVNINEHKIVIKHARKSLLFNNKQIWVKKKNSLFDVIIGAFDGAEVCELVGTFLLSQLSQDYNKVTFGLFQNDGLAVFKWKESNSTLCKSLRTAAFLFLYNAT